MNKNTNTKKKWLRLILEALIVIGLILVIRAWQQRNVASGVAPGFQSVLLDGNTVNLEDYKGKPVLIHFWAKWCPFCKIEEGSITDIQKDWTVLTVAYQSGNADDIKKHMQERKLQGWQTIVDEDGRLADLFGVTGVPASFILDSAGNIRFSEVGLTSEWGLRARLWWADKFPKKADNTPVTEQ